MNNRFSLHVVRESQGLTEKAIIVETPAALMQAVLEKFVDFGVEDSSPQWGQECLAKFYYLHIECGLSLEWVAEVFSSIEVKAVPIEVAAVEQFDGQFLQQIPVTLRRFIDYDEYLRYCVEKGLMVPFMFDSQEYTVICDV